MTFCFFTAQYAPNVGGVERYTQQLAQMLCEKGHRAIVVTSSRAGLPERETTPEGIAIYRLPSTLLMHGRFPVLRYGAAQRRLRALLAEEEIDFAVVQTRIYTMSLFGARFAKQYTIPALVLEHGTAHLLRGGAAGALGNLYEHMLCRWVRHYCKDFYGVSKACCAWLRHFHIVTDKTLYNAVTPAALQVLASDADKAFLAPYQGKTVIAFAGRFIPEKGVLPLLEAFARARASYPDAVLLLAGDGQQYAEAQRVLPEGAVLLGMLPYPQTLALLARADIFCLPSFSEGFACTVLEAAALRAVVLTTPTGGSPELICDDAHGLLFDDMSPDNIYAALTRALANPAWRAEAAENAYNRLSQMFTWEAVSEELVKIAYNRRSL